MTILERILYATKIGALASLVFFLVCLGIATLRISSDVRNLVSSTQSTLIVVQKDLDDVKVMTNSALFQAEEVLHHTDILVATENQSQEKQLAKINKVLDQLQITVESVNTSQQLITGDLHDTLKQTATTVQSLQPVIEQTQETIAKSGQTLDTINKQTLPQLTSVLKNTSDTMEHVSGTTADIQHEVHSIVYPPPAPWYKKYIWGPIKFFGHMASISVR